MLKTHGEKEIRFCVLCTWTRQMCLFFGLGVRFQTSEHYKCDWVSRCNYKKKEDMWGRCCTIASAQGSSRVFTPKLWMHADEAFSNWLEVGKKSPQGGLLRHTESWVVSTSCQEMSLAPSRHLTRSLLLSAPISSASSLNPSFYFFLIKQVLVWDFSQPKSTLIALMQAFTDLKSQ